MENNFQEIKSIIEELLDKMTISGEIEIVKNDECPQFIIRTQESGLLIGDNGQNFSALNYLIKRLVEEKLNKNNDEKIYFSIDVNDYQAKKTEELKNLAKMTAQRVKYFKKEIEMKPMTSYERRVIHSALTEDPDIITESVGEGADRRIVIKPYAD